MSRGPARYGHTQIWQSQIAIRLILLELGTGSNGGTNHGAAEIEVPV